MKKMLVVVVGVMLMVIEEQDWPDAQKKGWKKRSERACFLASWLSLTDFSLIEKKDLLTFETAFLTFRFFISVVTSWLSLADFSFINKDLFTFDTALLTFILWFCFSYFHCNKRLTLHLNTTLHPHHPLKWKLTKICGIWAKLWPCGIRIWTCLRKNRAQICKFTNTNMVSKTPWRRPLLFQN